MDSNYTKPERIFLKTEPGFSEAWVQELIARDPTIIGLGDLILRDRERIQPRAGRLDLLLQDPETKRRYEVELQLGQTDESHIIRTIEYWDIERKRYPQYEHCAVLIAEDITSRFLNVISLFNGTIPLIAIQMRALKIGEHRTIVFTTVLDEMARGYVDEDEDAESAPTDRAYWEERATKESLNLVDDMRNIVRELDSTLELKYNKFFIGFTRQGKPFNFVVFKPRKNNVQIFMKIPRSDEIDNKISESNLGSPEYSRHDSYLFRLTKKDIEINATILKDLATLAYQRRKTD